MGHLKLPEASMMMELNNVSVGYTKPLVSEINVRIEGHQFIALLGRNGTGKSTLLKSLAGMHPVLAGQVLIDGTLVSPDNQQALAKKIAVCDAKIAGPHLLVKDVLAMGRYPYTNWFNSKSADDEKQIAKIVDLLELAPFMERQVGRLSDGEKQKVNIAKALIQDTDIVVLDEPTAHLDYVNKLAIFKLLKEISSEKIVILVSHQLEMAMSFCEKFWLTKEDGTLFVGERKETIAEVKQAFGLEDQQPIEPLWTD